MRGVIDREVGGRFVYPYLLSGISKREKVVVPHLRNIFGQFASFAYLGLRSLSKIVGPRPDGRIELGIWESADCRQETSIVEVERNRQIYPVYIEVERTDDLGSCGNPRPFGEFKLSRTGDCLTRGSIGGSGSRIAGYLRVMGLKHTDTRDENHEEKGYSLHPLFYCFPGITLFIGGGFMVLYVWRKMNLDLSLDMHTPRYVALLLSACGLIWTGMFMLAAQL